MRDALPRMAALARPARSRRALGSARAGGLSAARPAPQRDRRRAPARSARSTCCSPSWRATYDRGRRAAFDDVPPPAAGTDITSATLALVTEAGLRAQREPRPTRVQPRAPLAELSDPRPGRLRCRATGRQCTAATTPASPTPIPNRLVPLDAVARARRRGTHRRRCTRRSTRRPATRRRWRRRPSSGRRSPQRLRDAGRPGGDPHRHLRDGHALRGNAEQGDRAGGHPDGLRHGAADDRHDGGRQPHVRGVAVTNPVGDPALGSCRRAGLRRRIVERALEMLASEVEPGRSGRCG